jgi:hypothetical protein
MNLCTIRCQIRHYLGNHILRFAEIFLLNKILDENYGLV